MIKMSKEEVIKLLIEREEVISDENRKSFSTLSLITGYSKRQLIRLSKELKDKPPEDVLKHKNTGRAPTNAACKSEIEFMIKLKAKYPVITIAQFKDYVDEDYLDNPSKKWHVQHYHLKRRSYSWYQNLFHTMNWKSPVKHKKAKTGSRPHTIRPPRPREGELVQVDGTPHDWFNDGNKLCLHLAVDDATSKVLGGYFTKNECLYGYCQLMVIVLKKHGIPEAVYSDKHQIFKSQDGTLTNFGFAMQDLGVEMIYANSPQAKGRVERMNQTEQNRIINDLKRFNVPNDIDELNKWFNDFYVDYLNNKFSYPPYDPNNAFVEIVDGQYDFNSLFSLRFTRVIDKNSSFSFNNHIYAPIDEETGEIVYIRKDVKVDVRFEILTNSVSIIRYGMKYICEDLGINAKGRRKNVIDNSKDLEQFFANKDRKEKKK